MPSTPRAAKSSFFPDSDQHLVESLASQAAIALTNRALINQLEDLFESFITLINIAIDEKSPYTGGHCERVPVLTMLLAEAASKAASGPLAGFRMSDKDRYELKIAGLLHDCGKITTPVHVVDKSSKLQTLFDRIHLIDTRFEVLKRDAEIDMLKQKLSALENGASDTVQIEAACQARIAQLDSDRAFLRKANIGGEFMAPPLQQRVKEIGAYRWVDESGQASDFLSAEEIHNLNIEKGTLTAEEREVINHHIVATINMLQALPWPTHLKHVPEYAAGHHERMDGTRLSERTERLGHAGAGAHHGDCRHFRSAHRQGPALQGRQEAERRPGRSWPHETGPACGPRPVRHFHPRPGLSPLCPGLS